MSSLFRVRTVLFVSFVLAACKTIEPDSADLAPISPEDAVQVVMSTSVGDIVFDIYPTAAPVTATNFLRYVDEARFDSAQFYRTVTMDNQPNNEIKIEVIQGGLGSARSMSLNPVAHETTRMTGLRHVDGTLSMARSEPGTASSEFFICIGDQPELDFGGQRNPDGQGFAAFGQVVRGIDVVQKDSGVSPKRTVFVASNCHSQGRARPVAANRTSYSSDRRAV